MIGISGEIRTMQGNYGQRVGKYGQYYSIGITVEKVLTLGA